MTVRVISTGPNECVAYQANDGIVYNLEYHCEICNCTFISDEPVGQCPNQDCNALVPHFKQVV